MLFPYCAIAFSACVLLYGHRCLTEYVVQDKKPADDSEGPAPAKKPAKPKVIVLFCISLFVNSCNACGYIYSMHGNF